MTRDTRTPAQCRAARSAIEARQRWIDAMRLNCPQDVLTDLAQNFAAGFKSTAEPSTGSIRAALALVASVIAIHWAGGLIV